MPLLLTPSKLADSILALLPSDGTPVLNRVMRAMLSRRLGTAVFPDLYSGACDLLEAGSKIGRLRGQGGQIFLSTGLVPPEVQPAVPQWPEWKLMAPLQRYLENTFRKGLDLPDGSLCLVQDTSHIGPPTGRWARPDFILVTAMRFRLLPGAQVDVHSFELKTESGGSVLAVHEALAQTRYTHFGHVVWHVPEGSKVEADLAEVEAHCGKHGIGLIRMRDPDDEASYEILVDPERMATRDAALDGFLDDRLMPEHRLSFVDAMTGFGRGL